MKRLERSVEFEATIERDGALRVPVAIVAALRGGVGARLRVRLTSTAIADGLRHRGVTEQEVEHIAATQLEPRGQVIAFLLSEGALTKKRRPPVLKKGRRS